MRRSGWVAVVAAVGLGLTGCSDPGTPSDTLPTATSTSAEPTLEPLGPADLRMPDAARLRTPDGASAFVSYYVSLINRAQDDLDVQYLEQFSSGCQTCDTLTSGLSDYAGLGYVVEGGEISVTSLNPPSISGADAQFVAVLSQAAATVRDADGVVQDDLSTAAAAFPGSGGVATWSEQTTSWQLTQLTIG